MLNVLSKIENARCCFLNKVSDMQQSSWKGEDETCLFKEAVFLFNNLKAAERSVLQSQNGEAQWDLSDFDIEEATVFAIEVLDGSTQIIYVAPTSYATKTEILDAIILSINSQGNFIATYAGDIITLKALNTSSIGVSLNLNIINPYEIKNRTIFGNYNYSMTTNAEMFGASSCYNPFDNLVWTQGVVAPSTAAISFDDILNLTEQDFKTYPGTRTFVPNSIPAPAINLLNKRMYFGGYDGTQYFITSVGADPNDVGAYKEIISQIQPIDSQTVVKSIFYNPLNELMYFKCIDNTAAPHILILDSNEAVINDILLTNDAAHSLIAANRPFYSSYNPNTKNTYLTTNKLVVMVDGDPTSGTYCQVIAEYPSPRPSTHNFSSIIWNNGKFLVAMYDSTFSTTPATEYVYEMDASGNFTEVIATPGIFNINIANGYLVVNSRDVSDPNSGALNKVDLYDSDYTLVSSITTGVATYYTASAAQTDQTRLNYVLEGTNFLAVFESTIETFSYTLAFTPPAQSTNPCFTQSQQDKLISNLLKECGCSENGEVGSFGDSVNILGDGNGNAIDGNGNYIQV